MLAGYGIIALMKAHSAESWVIMEHSKYSVLHYGTGTICETDCIRSAITWARQQRRICKSRKQCKRCMYNNELKTFVTCQSYMCNVEPTITVTNTVTGIDIYTIY